VNIGGGGAVNGLFVVSDDSVSDILYNNCVGAVSGGSGGGMSDMWCGDCGGVSGCAVEES